MNVQLQDTLTREKAFRNPENIKIVIAVWNLQGRIPPHNSVKLLIQKITKGMADGAPDIFCIATQECQRSICLSFFCENKEEWEDILKECAVGYKMFDSQTMNALHTALFVKNDLISQTSTRKKSYLRGGFCKCLGNKGAISITITILQRNIQLINCHLQPHQNSNKKRNDILLDIIQKLIAGKGNNNQIFIFGDLNYRIQMTKQQYQNLIQNKNNTQHAISYVKMLNKDQLANQQILKQYFFPYYQQQIINFPPTYKISQNGPQYNRKRIPGWTDRIFHRKSKTRQMSYQCMYDLYGTDHRPVLASFQVSNEDNTTIFLEKTSVRGKQDGQCSLI